MIINHNITALKTYGQLSSANSAQSKSMEKLSSGQRINSAADDAAGLAISEKMRAQVRGLDQATANAQDGISLIQTAEGALSETTDILQRMRELAVQAGNDTNTESDRKEIQKEVNQMTSEINRIGNTTQFNEMNLLDGTKSITKTGHTNLTTPTAVTKTAAPAGVTGDVTAIGEYTGDADKTVTLSYDKTASKWSYAVGAGAATELTGDTFEVDGIKFDKSGLTGTGTANGSYSYDLKKATGTTDNSLTLQIGANEKQSMSVDISDMRAKALGLTSTGTGADRGVTDGTSNEIKEQALSVLTHDQAEATVTKIQSAIDKVSAERSKLGANQNRLEHTINNLSTSSENLTAAESRIRDVDMAKEMMTQTKNSILSQAAQAMLAQANQQPQNVLQLLR